MSIFEPVGGVGGAGAGGGTDLTRAERITFRPSPSSSKSSYEARPRNNDPITVVFGEGPAEILDRISGNDFHVAAGVYLVKVEMALSGVTTAYAQAMIRRASDNSILADSNTDFSVNAGSDGTALFAILTLESDTSVNLLLDRDSTASSAYTITAASATFYRWGGAEEIEVEPQSEVPGYAFFSRPPLDAPDDITSATAIPSSGEGYVWTLLDDVEIAGSIQPGIPFLTEWEGALELQISANARLELCLHTDHTINGKSFTHTRRFTVDMPNGQRRSIPMNVFDSISYVRTGTVMLPGGGSVEITREDLEGPTELGYRVEAVTFQRGGTRRQAANITLARFENLDTYSYQIAAGTGGQGYQLPTATETGLGGVRGATAAQAVSTTGSTILGWAAARIVALVRAQVPPVFRTGNTDKIPSTKLPSASEGTEGTVEAATAAEATAPAGTAIRAWAAARIVSLIGTQVPAVFRTGNTARIPTNKLPAATEGALGGVQGATQAQAGDTSGTTILGWSAVRILALAGAWRAIVPQAEAVAGTATTARWWTAQRVRQAIRATAATQTARGSVEIGENAEYDAGTSTTIVASLAGIRRMITRFGASPLTVADEGTALATAATELDFVGAGVTVTNKAGAAAEKEIQIAGAPAPVNNVAHIERIYMRAVASASTDVKMRPRASTPIEVIKPSGESASILSGISGNDFEVAAGSYIVFWQARATAGNNRITWLALRQASNNAELVTASHNAFRGTSQEGVGGAMFLDLAADTTIHAFLHRSGGSIELAAGAYVEFARIGTAPPAVPTLRPQVTQFTVTGDDSPAAGTNIGSDTYSYVAAVANSAEAQGVRIIGFTGTTPPDNPTVLATFAMSDFARATGSVTIPASTTLANAGDTYTLRLQALAAQDDVASYQDYHIVAHAAARGRVHFGAILANEGAEDVQFNLDDIGDDRSALAGTYTVSGLTANSRLYFFWPSTLDPIADIRSNGTSILNTFEAQGTRTISGIEYHYRLLFAAVAVGTTYNGTMLEVTT